MKISFLWQIAAISGIFKQKHCSKNKLVTTGKVIVFYSRFFVTDPYPIIFLQDRHHIMSTYIL